MNSRRAALHGTSIGSQPYVGSMNAGVHLNESDPYSAGMKCLENANRFDREGNYSEALEEARLAVDHFGNYLLDVNDSFSDGANSRTRVDLTTITSATRSLDIAKLKRDELHEKIRLEESCRITIFATVFGVEGLKSNDARYLEARAEIYTALGIPDGAKHTVLEKAIKLAETNLRLADKDLIDEHDAKELIKDGYVLGDEIYRSKPVGQWVEEITLKFNSRNGATEINNPAPPPVQVSGVVSDINPAGLQSVDPLPVNENVTDLGETDAAPVTITGLVDDPSANTNNDTNIGGGADNDETEGLAGTASTFQAEDEEKIILPELSDLVNGSSDNDLITLSAKLVGDGILDNNNEKELRIILFIGKNKEVAELVKNKDYRKFEDKEEIQNIFDGVKVVASSQLPGLRDRITGFFGGMKTPSVESNPGEGINNFSLAFGVDAKIVGAYINGTETKPVLAPTEDDIELAMLEIILSLQNEPKSTLFSSDTPGEFIDGLKRQLLGIGVGLEHVVKVVDERDLLIAKCFWQLSYESDLVRSSELLVRANESIVERKLDEINIIQLIETLDKLNKLCVGTEVLGISGDLFTVDITSGRKNSSDDYLVELYRKAILEEPISTYDQLLAKLKSTIFDKAQIIEIILNRKLRLTPLDYCIIVACRLYSDETDDSDFRTLFGKALSDNGVNYEIKPGNDFEEEIERRVSKINRILGDPIKITRQEEAVGVGAW